MSCRSASLAQKRKVTNHFSIVFLRNNNQLFLPFPCQNTDHSQRREEAMQHHQQQQEARQPPPSLPSLLEEPKPHTPKHPSPSSLPLPLLLPPPDVVRSGAICFSNVWQKTNPADVSTKAMSVRETSGLLERGGCWSACRTRVRPREMSGICHRASRRGVKHAPVVCCLRPCTTGWNEVLACPSNVRESSIPMAMTRQRPNVFPK